MDLETINKWLDEEYGCSCTKLEELHDFYFEKYCDLKQENKQLQEELEWTIGIVEHNRIISEKNKEIHQLKDNWNKLKEIIRKKQDYYRYVKDNRYRKFLSELLDKMQELEGSDE